MRFLLSGQRQPVLAVAGLPRLSSPTESEGADHLSGTKGTLLVSPLEQGRGEEATEASIPDSDRRGQQIQEREAIARGLLPVTEHETDNKETVGQPQGQEGEEQAMNGEPKKSAVRNMPGWQHLAWLVGWLLAAGLLFYHGARATFGPKATRQTSQDTTKRICDVHVGDRVLTQNPTGEEDHSLGEVDQASWRKIELDAAKEDGSRAEVVLLRPLSWLEERQVRVGGEVRIRAPECGISGAAVVRSIGACPPIKSGPGSVVTGTFKHTSARVVLLRIEGEAEPVGTTTTHRFWSVDRERFVKARDLRVGEQLQGLRGTLHVVGLLPGELSKPVFNLEVSRTHVFHVSTSGILVHNSDGPRHHVEVPLALQQTPGLEWFAKLKMNWLEMGTSGTPAALQGLFSQKGASGFIYFVYDAESGELLKLGSGEKSNVATGVTTDRYFGSASAVKKALAPKEAAAWGNEPGWQNRTRILLGYATIPDELVDEVTKQNTPGRTLDDLEQQLRDKIDSKAWRASNGFDDVPMNWDWTPSRQNVNRKPNLNTKVYKARSVEAVRAMDPSTIGPRPEQPQYGKIELVNGQPVVRKCP